MKATIRFFIISHSVLLIVKKFHTEVVEKLEIHIYVEQTFFFPKIVPFMRLSGKILRVGQGTDDNMAHAHCMLDTYGYKYTYRLCNIKRRK
jgi:hypothetical protein